jgi:hypothetical protein
MASLLDRAQSAAQPPQMAPPQETADPGEDQGDFERPNLKALIPKGQEDAVARIVAAGMKIMYSPEMRPEVMKALKAPGPLAQTMAMNVTGLILMLDKKSQGGLPVQAIFPAAMELLGEAAEAFEASGRPVAQNDYADAVRLMLVILAKKMGATDEQIMAEAGKHTQQGAAPPDEEGPQDMAAEPGGEPAPEEDMA